MRTFAGKAVFVALILALGIGMAFWGCSKKSTTAPTTAGRLFIWSLPDSAAVSIDGVTQTGLTPITLQNVSFAQHIIRCTKGNYAAVDTVVVHTGRSTPDTSFCWIPGKVNITSDPANAFVYFIGRKGLTGGGSVGVWTASSDTYQVTCSLSTVKRFKAVDTIRIWADSTSKNYLLPPKVDSTVVLYHVIGTSGRQHGTSFGHVDSAIIQIWLGDTVRINNLTVRVELKFNGSVVLTSNYIIPSIWDGFEISWVNSSPGQPLPVGNYSQPTTWVVNPHEFFLSEPSWIVTTTVPGGPSGPRDIKSFLRPLRGF